MPARVAVVETPLVRIDNHHPPLTIEINLQHIIRREETNNEIYFRNFKKLNYQVFNQELFSIDWSFHFTTALENVNMLGFFYQKIYSMT
jgi:hypothetical protein